MASLLENSSSHNQGGAKPGALVPDSVISDPGLAAEIDAWPGLPQAIKAGILAMIWAAK